MIGDLELEGIAARGWQAEHTHWLGEWLLRANAGFTGRANSVLPLGDPGMPLDAALAACESWYDERGLRTRMAVPSPARDDLEASLRQRGWTRAWGAHVMVATAARLAVPGGADVAVLPTPSSGWEAAYHYRGGPLPEAGRRLLVRAEPVGFAEVVDGGAVVAIGRGTADDGWLGVTAIEVAPSHRRRGLATRVLGGLVAWGRGHGAANVYLQVDLANEVALLMYRRAGFVEHHAYRYLDSPAD